MLNALRQRTHRQRLAEKLYEGATARARNETFYRRLAVPDTIDGRFDLLAFHAWLMLEALEGRGMRDVAQDVVNVLFARFDEGLRELGAGDIGMARRMKKMADAFYGRLEAYRAAADEHALADAIVRNLYRGAAEAIEPALTLAGYAETARAHLAQARLDLGELDFGPPPAMA